MNKPNEPTQLLASSTPFKINKEYLKQEARHPQYRKKFDWFFCTLPKKIKEEFRKEWYQTMEDNGINIPMFTYLEIYTSNHKIDYPFQERNMFQNTQNWKTTNKIISSNPLGRCCIHFREWFRSSWTKLMISHQKLIILFGNKKHDINLEYFVNLRS